MFKGSRTMNAIVMNTDATNFESIKIKQNAAWGSGDYSKVGVTLQITGEELAETLDLPPGARVLDVAAGNGNATMAFARRWADVTSTDFVASLLDGGKARAEAAGFDIDFQLADAENLPFDDDVFDAVVSTFGVMFTPDQKRSTSELARVCKSGGKIGLANWTPDGLIGKLFETIGNYVPTPKDIKSPALWGSQKWIEDSFSNHSKSTAFNKKNFVFRYNSPAHFIDFFRAWYGPVQKAFEVLDVQEKRALEQELLKLLNKFNTATDGTLRAPSEYAEIVITKY